MHENWTIWPEFATVPFEKIMDMIEYLKMPWSRRPHFVLLEGETEAVIRPQLRINPRYAQIFKRLVPCYKPARQFNMQWLTFAQQKQDKP